MRVRCEQYESSTPYFPLRRLLRDVLGVAADASPDDVAAHLTGRVAAATPHLLPWVPLLGIPLDVPLPPTRETAELDERSASAGWRWCSPSCSGRC